MAKLKLLSTIFSKLGSLTKNNGQIIVSRDSKSLYVDLDDERIEITDWIDINTEENLLAILTPLTNKYYYTKDSNKIWRYINNDWECLNTSVNDLTPTYTESSNLVKLSSGEKLSVAFGKISKAITDLISHISDSVKHITSAERSNWNAAKTHADSTHAPADAQKNVQSDWSATSGDAYIKNKPTEFPPSIHTHTKLEISDFPSSLPASGGNSDTVNNHTVETDVPVNAMFTDTIYDDTEVKESIAELNSNLDTLEFGDVAGGKNLFNPKFLLNATYDEKTHTITVSNNTNKALDMVFKENTQYTFSAYIKQSNSTTNNRLNIIYTDGTFDSVFLYTQSTSEIYISATSQSGKTISEVKWNHGSSGTATFRNFQIEEGTTSTPYEPYIPSVKMLAEENAQQSTEAMDLKMLGWSVPSECPVQNYIDSDGVFHQKVGRVDLGSIEWEQGGKNARTSWVPKTWKGNYKIPTITGIKANIYCVKYTTDYDFNVESQVNDKTISINKSGWVYIYDSDFVSATASEFKASLKELYLYYELATPITMTIDGNEAVTQIKNDLGGLSFSVRGTTLSITDGTNTWTLSN